MIARLDRDFVIADLAKVESIIEELTPSDFLTRMGLESRRDELRERLLSMDVSEHPLASSALFFSRSPVAGSRGIDGNGPGPCKKMSINEVSAHLSDQPADEAVTLRHPHPFAVS